MTRTYLQPSAFFEAPLAINEPQLCTQYSKEMQALPSKLSTQDLAPYLAFLLDYPYLNALSNLASTVFSPGKRLSSEALSKIEKMVSDMQTSNTLTQAAAQPLEEGFYFSLIQRGTDYLELLRKMNQIPNCIPAENKNEFAKRIQQDINLGACVKFFGEDAYGVAKSYFRNYLTLDKNGKILMQIDATEAGTSSYWTKLGQWVQANRGKEFLYGIASSVYLADKLDISQLVLGDFESDEIGKMIGCRRIRVYGPDVPARKIGLIPRIENDEGETIADGVFVNRLAKDSVQRVLDLGLRSTDVKALANSVVMQDGFGADYDPLKKREVELIRIILGNLSRNT